MLNKKQKAAPQQIPKNHAGNLVGLEQSKGKTIGREKSELSRAQSDRNKWFLLSLILGAALILTANGWRVADNRFTENVRVAWVKLDPSGGYTVEFHEEHQPINYYQATIDSKMFEWVEKRFSKRKKTISEDSGFSYILMSPALQQVFINEEKAAERASEHEKCLQCNEIELKVRVIDHIDEINKEDDKAKTLYHSIAYATEIERSQDGTLVNRVNKIVNLTWRLKTKAEITADKENLRYNPVGISIERYSIKEDPNTPADS